MGRPKAGHGWSIAGPPGKHIHVMQLWDGKWVTTGVATGWPRCWRCRVPVDRSPFDTGLCSICYFYHAISVKAFWLLHNAGYELAPYNIGKAGQSESAWKVLHELNHASNWRAVIRRQFTDSPPGDAGC